MQAGAQRIAVFGLFGSGNTGNDGSLEAMLCFLRKVRPDSAILCICGEPQTVSGRFEVATVPIVRPLPEGRLLRVLDRMLLGGPRRAIHFLDSIRRLRAIDVLIVPGTGVLDDFAAGPMGWPLCLFTWCLAARLAGTRLAFVSIGAGPIHHPLSRWLMKRAIGAASFRSYRDTISKEFMESIGFDTRNDPVYPDLAFKLPSPRAASVDDTGTLTVGVGVMAYYGWRNDTGRGAVIYRAYLEKMTAFVRWLLERGHRVRLLTGDRGDDRAVSDLMQALARTGIPASDRLLAAPARSLHELMEQIVRTDIVVATRFHNIVCALKLGRPALSLSYARKNDVLMAEMGLGDYCHHVERFDVDWLKERFVSLIADRAQVERQLRDANSLYQRRLAQQDSLLVATLLSPPARLRGVGERLPSGSPGQ